MNRPTVSLLALAILLPPVHAHEFWVAPSDHSPETGAPFALDLRVGEPFRGDPVARDDDHAVRFALVAPDGTSGDVVGRGGAAPAGLARGIVPGLHVLVYESRPTYHTMTADRFDAYLREEGLDAVADMRQRRGDGAADVREAFSRHARALIDVGGSGSGTDRPLGLPLEIVVEGSPSRVREGEALALRVLHHGAPLAGARVGAIRAGARERSGVYRTDGEGRVVVPIDASDVWLVHTIHMIEIDAPHADWHSLWASLTFEIPSAP